MTDLVETITTMRNKSTNELLSEKEIHALVLKFERSINHPGGSDLLFYPELVGLPGNATVDEIVDLARKGIEEKSTMPMRGVSRNKNQGR